MIREYDNGLNALLDLFLDSGFIGTWSFEKILIINESFSLLCSCINEGSHSLKNKGLVVLQEDKRLHFLVKSFVGIEWEWIWIVGLASDFNFLKPDLDLIVLAFDLYYI